MKFRKFSVENQAAGMQMAPMIDVVFLLLIFFLVTWSYARFETELDISVPTADESQEPRRRFGEQIINVTKTGEVVINSVEMNDQELLDALLEVSQLRPDQSVILRGDAETAYEHIVRVLNICYKAKIFNVAFASKPPEKQP